MSDTPRPFTILRGDHGDVHLLMLPLDGITLAHELDRDCPCQPDTFDAHEQHVSRYVSDPVMVMHHTAGDL